MKIDLSYINKTIYNLHDWHLASPYTSLNDYNNLRIPSQIYIRLKNGWQSEPLTHATPMGIETLRAMKFKISKSTNGKYCLEGIPNGSEIVIKELGVIDEGECPEIEYPTSVRLVIYLVKPVTMRKVKYRELHITLPASELNGKEFSEVKIKRVKQKGFQHNRFGGIV